MLLRTVYVLQMNSDDDDDDDDDDDFSSLLNGHP